MLFEVNIPDDTCIVHCSIMYTERQKKLNTPILLKREGGGGWLWILWLPLLLMLSTYIHTLKTHVRDKRLYGTLIYVDPRDSFHTMCCWMRKMRVQRTSEHDPGPPTEFSVPSPDPIWPSELHYARARIRAIIYNRGCCIQRLFDILANHRTHNTSPHCHLDWLCNGGWTLGWTNEKP